MKDVALEFIEWKITQNSTHVVEMQKGECPLPNTVSQSNFLFYLLEFRSYTFEGIARNTFSMNFNSAKALHPMSEALDDFLLVHRFLSDGGTVFSIPYAMHL